MTDPDDRPHPEPTDGREPAVRASDAERDAALAVLRDAVGDGRLTLEEMVERVDLVLAARTRDALAATTADLPAEAAAGPRRRPSRWLVGIMGGMDRTGRWRVARRCWVLNLMGGCDLDLRSATLEDPETEIVVISLMGGSDIVVPEGTAVELGGIALMGGNRLTATGPAPARDAPVVRVRAFSIMGGTDVTTRPGRRMLAPGDAGTPG